MGVGVRASAGSRLRAAWATGDERVGCAEDGRVGDAAPTQEAGVPGDGVQPEDGWVGDAGRGEWRGGGTGASERGSQAARSLGHK